MTVWHERVPLYKAAFLGVITGSVIFAVGFCVPAWTVYEDGYFTKHNMGLWQICTADLSMCQVSISDSNPGWLKAVRALESVAMFFTIVTCIVGFYTNCVLKAQVHSNFFNKNMETSAIVSVAFGAFGLVIFSTQSKRSSFPHHHDFHYSWGFVLVWAAHSITCLSAFIMILSSKLQAAWARQALNRYNVQSNHQYPSNGSPDYIINSDTVYITSMEHQMGVGPPPYETVVNCIPQEEPAPPPYYLVTQSQ